MDVQTALFEAVGHLQGGRFTEAEEMLRQILQAAPEQPDALHFLGILAYQQGRAGEAIDLIERALAAHPDFPDALNNLGNILKETGDLEGAEGRYRRAIELRPTFAEPLGNLGTVLRGRGKSEEAIDSLRRAIALKPDDSDLLYNLGNALRDTGRTEEAIKTWRRVLGTRPDHGESLRSLGHALVTEGHVDEAAALYREWIGREPNNPVPRHLLAGCSEEDAPDRAPDDYVRTEFDRLAPGFDSQLKFLDYQGPELVGTQLAREFGTPSASLTVLDGGCGTGLAGEILRPYARRLVGLDLSPRMLAVARGRGSYDDLLETEFTAHLEASPDTYDLVVGADTLVYFGDLGPFLGAVHTSLRPGGHVIFIVEQADPVETRPYHLNPHGRYSHTRDYLESAVADAGFEVTALAHDVLRREAGDPVGCMVVMARR